MHTPRWFWIVLACCLVVVTVAASWRLRYVSMVSNSAPYGALDLWTKTYCQLDQCAPFGAYRMPAHDSSLVRRP